MTYSVKIDLDKTLKSNQTVIIKLGCGPKKKAGTITIDKIDMPSVDIIADLEEGLPFLPDDSADQINCKSILEHIDNFENLIREIVRILKKDGKVHIFVPYFSNPYFYSDFTHKRLFGLYSFDYFVDTEKQLKRKVSNLYKDIRIEIISLHLVFRSPFWFSHQLKKLFGLIINCLRSLMEYFKQHLCYLCPCYGIEVVFKPA